MSDAAAASLSEWFLTDPPARSIATLAEILQGDPPLALWVALKADRLASSPPQTILELAARLAEHGLAWLQWEADSAARVIDARSCDEIAARVAVAILVSEQAAALAAPHGEASTSQARFLGLFQDPAQWLTTVRYAGAGQTGKRLPNRLAAQHFDRTVVESVAQAVRDVGIPARDADSPTGSLKGEAVPLAANGGLSAILRDLDLSPGFLRRGLDSASRWAASHKTGCLLRNLMARLLRLSVLERSFGEAVEADKMAAMAEFAAGAGHEINNPLAVIAGRAQLLLRDETAPERRRNLALMHTQAMRVHEMIGDLRLFATPPELETQSLDLNVLVCRSIDELQPLAVSQETVITVVPATAEVRIAADPAQLTIAIQSLCHNALEALGQHGRIEVVVGICGNDSLVTVADDGPGISPEQRPHVFEPFYSARQAGRGIGMGLSKCWRIVTLHGGRIEVTNRAGSGAVFTIRLPLALTGMRLEIRQLYCPKKWT